MPKKFSETEKTQIKQKLLDSARSLFTRYGIKKTSVEDLTKGAGIAVGTFYAFYQSKEELFFELLEVEESEIRAALFENAADRPLNKEYFKSFLLKSFKLMSENPIVQQILLAEQYEALIRKVPPERLERNYHQDQDFFYPLIEKWQAEGLLIKSPPELIVSMIRSLVLLSLHRREIGESVYEDTLELLISTIAEGLFIREEHNRND